MITMGNNGGFNPFRDAKGPFTDPGTGGTGGAAKRTAPGVPKTSGRFQTDYTSTKAKLTPQPVYRGKGKALDGQQVQPTRSRARSLEQRAAARTAGKAILAKLLGGSADRTAPGVPKTSGRFQSNYTSTKAKLTPQPVYRGKGKALDGQPRQAPPAPSRSRSPEAPASAPRTTAKATVANLLGGRR
jgi:hypothetical protein